MKAAVLWKPHDLRVEEEWLEPEPAPDQVKIRITYCGICGSDVEVLEGRFNPARFAAGQPRLLGHESCGTIVKIGSAVRANLQVGQRVAVYFRSACGACYYCNNGQEHFCERAASNSGGFAEYGVFKEGTVYPVPEGVSMEEAALTEPVSVAIHGIDMARVRPGSSVAVIGAGPIGLLLLQVAMKAGAARTLVSEPVAGKRQVAQDLGADVVVDPLTEDLEAAARKLTDSRGFDTVLEASGKPACARQAVYLAANGGTIVWAGVYPGDALVSVPPFYMYDKELNIQSIKISPYTFPRAVALVPKLQLKPLITDIMPLKDIVKAFDVHSQGKAIKMLIKP